MRVARADDPTYRGSSRQAFCSAPTAIIGAIKTIRKIMVRVICICLDIIGRLSYQRSCRKLIELRNRKNFHLSKHLLSNISRKTVAILEAKKPTRTAQIAPSNVTTNINQPW
jgi:hypothetical protein